jgi:YidC/Oxa1 family membrane protein insertase
MVVSQVLMQKMTPSRPPPIRRNQQRMMMVMPRGLSAVMFYSAPSGLVLYYLTSNLVSVGQQWFFNHTALADQVAESVALPKKKIGRK